MLPFTITVEDVQDAIPADGVCPVLGVQMTKGHGFSSRGESDTGPPE